VWCWLLRQQRTDDIIWMQKTSGSVQSCDSSRKKRWNQFFSLVPVIFKSEGVKCKTKRHRKSPYCTSSFQTRWQGDRQLRFKRCMCWLHYSGSLKKGEPFFTKEMNVQLKFRQKESNGERLRYGLQSKQTAKGRVIIRPTVVFTEIQRLPDLYLEVVFLKKISCQWSKVEFLLWS